MDCVVHARCRASFVRTLEHADHGDDRNCEQERRPRVRRCMAVRRAGRHRRGFADRTYPSAIRSLDHRASAMVRAHRSLDLIKRIRLNAFGILWRAAVLYLAWAAVWPTGVSSLGPHPKPARDYESGIQSA